MPNMSGDELIENVQKFNISLEFIIVVTAYTTDNFKHIRDSVDMFFNKPIDIDQIKECVNCNLN